MSKQDVSVEFLIEPFREAEPGPHVQAGVKVITQAGLDVELGPFSSSTTGELDDIADVIGSLVREAMTAGASSIRIHVASEEGELAAIGSLEHALSDLLRAAERDIGATTDAWDRSQMQTAVRLLHERGAFLLRGSVDNIAAVMGVSRITIYNYLNAIDQSGTSES